MAEWRQAAREQREELARQIARLGEIQRTHRTERHTLEAERAGVLADLTKALLPDLTPETLRLAGDETGFLPLRNDDPPGQREAERRALSARLAEIEADPRFDQRELLRAPRVGQLTRQVDELEEYRAPMAETLARAAHPRLARLIEVGYGTSSYQVAFWRMSYYRDWAAGDEILARFPDKKSFADLREEMTQATETLRVYDQKLGELRAEIAAGEALEREHEERRQALETVDARHLETWRSRLAEHIGAVDAATLATRLAGRPEVAPMLVRADGLGKKLEYLDQIVDSQIRPLENDLLAEDRKLLADMNKNANPKKAGLRFDEETMRKRFQDRPAKIRRRWDTAVGTYQTVYVFDRYDQGSLIRDFLWWDLITDGRLDGNFIPEVAQRHHDAAMTNAAATVAAIDRSESPSGLDPS
jgi:hypothetical protein